MGIYDAFSTSAEVEKDGVILELAVNDDGTTAWMRIARAGGGNERYAKAVEANLKPYRRQIQAGTLDKALAERLAHKIYAEAIVLEWGGILGRDGKKIPFSKAAVEKVFADLPELFADVRAAAEELALFREQLREADSKN